MTYLELVRKADRLLVADKITIGEYERMTEPLRREIGETSVLEEIKAEIQQIQKDYHEYGWTYDDVIGIINKHLNGDMEK